MKKSRSYVLGVRVSASALGAESVVDVKSWVSVVVLR